MPLAAKPRADHPVSSTFPGVAVTTQSRTGRPDGSTAQRRVPAMGLVTAPALLLPPSVNAASRQFSDGQLSAASHAVKQSGVGGIPWYVDDSADRVVVTTDSSVSPGEESKI